ncbi:MAG: response regulator transcription factor [Lachnospiraceae bacterium]|nr:response regulator transcription factor [Lachnospiraceae bacterium]
MLRIAIVEDDPESAGKLREFIERYASENHLEEETTCFSDGLELVNYYRPVWDIIFLDIEMPHMDGMTAAQKIREQDPAVVLIFVTNMARYAVKGYEVDAMDFILKPVAYMPFSLKLRKAVNQVKSRENRFLLVNRDGEALKIPTGQIQYIEVVNHRLHIHTEDMEYTVRGSLQEIEKQLEDLPFARSSVSFLINLKNVVSVYKDTVYMKGQELPIGRTRRKEFLERFFSYMGGGFQ